MMEDVLTPLGEAFYFTNEDLRTNRERRISGAQRRRLWGRFLITFWGGILLAAAPMLVVWGLIWWSTDLSFTAAINDSRAWIGYLVGVLLGVMFAIANFKTLFLWIDLLSGRVRMLKGVAQVWGQYLMVGRYRFVMNEEAQGLVQSGVTYRVYLLSASSTLLSIEFAE